ncbi:MAG: tRNA (guanosine(46)-N7)-methyltransferase TrmB [Prevotellaceae bacterium]|jgi:tRNA (guanine-N7-)-methyltransferase|nr:tRNA (guanosine(46)-N7)-methyltransferase TrmB [Prevotellaceae bacterium]
MGKNKHLRFAENTTFALLHQPAFDDIFNRDYRLKGQWHASFFRNGNPLTLELGCGRGEYTVELARQYPSRNFIGIDIKGARLWRGAKTATEEALPNVAFIRTRIDFITSFFAPDEVDELWITFPDPQLKAPRKRLTSPLFLARYAAFLKPGGRIHLKTDSQLLHEYTIALIRQNGMPLYEAHSDIYGTARADDILSIKTHYETQFLQQGLRITYLCFGLSQSVERACGR